MGFGASNYGNTKSIRLFIKNISEVMVTVTEIPQAEMSIMLYNGHG